MKVASCLRSFFDFYSKSHFRVPDSSTLQLSTLNSLYSNPLDLHGDPTMSSGRASEFKPIPLSTSVGPQTRSQQQQAVSQSTDPRSRTTTTDKKGNGGFKRAIGRVESPTLEEQFATHAAEKEPVAAALLPDLKRARLTWSSTGAIP